VKAELGVPDIVVSNAGLFIIKPLAETSPADFVQSIATNLTGPFLIAHALVPDLVHRGSGHLVTIGSSSDRIAYPWNTAYGASKHGVRGLHEVIAVEVARTGVRTTLISPGRVDTEMWDDVDPELRPDAAGRSVMMRVEDVADAVVWAVTRPAHVDVTEIQMMPTIDKARG
jgi:3-hydroxy acid dehydrogenase/malonic semialdehyde reductase